MWVSKLLGVVGVIYALTTISLGYLTYDVIQDFLFILYPDKSMYSKVVINFSIMMLYLLLLVPGLVLLWLSEMGLKFKAFSYLEESSGIKEHIDK